MFLKGLKTEIEVPVTAKLFGEDGKPLDVPFIAVFKRHEEPNEAKNRLKQANEGVISEQDLMRMELVRWKRMPRDDGGEVEFSEEALDEALRAVEYRKALYVGWMQAHFGREVLQQKNS